MYKNINLLIHVFLSNIKNAFSKCFTNPLKKSFISRVIAIFNIKSLWVSQNFITIYFYYPLTQTSFLTRNILKKTLNTTNLIFR